MITDYHAKYYAHEIVKHHGANDVERLSRSLFDSCVDLNPHQIEAALFALRSPISKGVILADEVGLGKTIEAGVLLCQLWAEKKRKLIIICPASLRKQWAMEMEEKFNLPSIILEARSYKALKKKGHINPFDIKNSVIICSYQFASRWKEDVRAVNWDLATIDEAHKLRNVYRPSNVTGQNIKWALGDSKKVLLTATPLQNSLMELYGLATLIDDEIFGDVSSFRTQYTNAQSDIADLQDRLRPFCKRTLRSQVLEYVPYTERKALTSPFSPSNQEQELYDAISEFLLLEETYALPYKQRHLTSLILRKLLASSTCAVAGTLRTMRNRLQDILDGLEVDDSSFVDDIVYSEDIEEELLELEALDSDAAPPEFDRKKLTTEIQTLDDFIRMAEAIHTDAKSVALLTALKTGFNQMSSMGAENKALIFTESRRTQNYLKIFLEANGYRGKIALFNGTNSDPDSKIIYEDWVRENAGSGRDTGTRAVDIRSAIVENFRDTSEIMIATEAASEGINLQFCSLVINYDLPWNPQRVEQRIGRCHRYGQKHDVVVVNFLNQRNEADLRVHQLLEHKFNLFQGVFGASDEVLGSIESGVDFEKRILAIYETCRTNEQIQDAFNQLQAELDQSIQSRLNDTRQLLFDHFDEDVHARLKMQLDDAKRQLDKISQLFWEISKHQLHKNATFSDQKLNFQLHQSPVKEADITPGTYHLIRKDQKNTTGRFLYRLSHPLGEHVIETSKSAQLPIASLTFDISQHPTRISMVESLIGKSGWLTLSKLTIQSLDEQEELVFAATVDDGSSLDQETCQKLFSCLAQQSPADSPDPHDTKRLKAELHQIQTATLNRVMEYNNQFFREEHARIDKWSDDMLIAAEKELKDVRDQVKSIGRQMRLAESVEEQAQLQARETECVKKRRRLRNKLDDVEDAIEDKARTMRDQLQARLKQKVTTSDLFTIRWSVV